MIAPAFDHAASVRRGVRLEYITISYNCLEGAIALVAGFLAGSVALIGFGFDSAIEVASGIVLVWRLGSKSHGEERDAIALRIVGACFVALAAYVGYDALTSLLLGHSPDRSIPGIALAAVSLIVMPVLAQAKRRVAGKIGSAALTADARQTEFCTYLSAILLAGLLLNALFGWWWADPIAAFVMVPIIAKEGFDALRGKTCCATCH
jgi:divalent metal cation (Fe/Co/Zn/Cd) transporter